MLNQTVIVGRLVRDPELQETENGHKLASITLAVPRSYKNANGEYDTDFISCVLWRGIAENTVEYCKKGDLLGNKFKWYTNEVQIIIALFINDFKGIFFFVIRDVIK